MTIFNRSRPWLNTLNTLLYYEEFSPKNLLWIVSNNGVRSLGGHFFLVVHTHRDLHNFDEDLLFMRHGLDDIHSREKLNPLKLPQNFRVHREFHDFHHWWTINQVNIYFLIITMFFWGKSFCETFLRFYSLLQRINPNKLKIKQKFRISITNSWKLNRVTEVISMAKNNTFSFIILKRTKTLERKWFQGQP